MNELELLEELVPRDGRPGNWDDVLRRAARPRFRMRALVAAAAVVAVVGVAPAVAVVVLRHGGGGLPAGADRNNVIVAIQPVTGRVLYELAPWKGHDGFCYLVLGTRAGCVPRSRQTVVLRSPLYGWTFDRRVVSGTVTTRGGRTIPLVVRRFGGRIDATFFLVRDRLPRPLGTVELRDANGHVVERIR
jgi:hypothetical protein